MPHLLEVVDLVKKFKKATAVDGIRFGIDAGACFGLLGPNGAGKTTTIEIIEGIIPPTSGRILYRGEPRTPDFREAIGIQFQHTTLFSFMTVRETLETFQQLYRHTASVDELMKVCRLEEVADRYNDRISGGQKQRLLLAMALINDPDLLFLDEPSTGLDPQARRNLWDIILEIKQAGKTLILTTHYMEEAQNLCDEIVIMDRGRVIAQGAPSALIRTHCRGTTVILPWSSVRDDLSDLSVNGRKTPQGVEIQTDDVNRCLKELMDRSVDLREITVRSPNLEDVFLKLTGRRLRE